VTQPGEVERFVDESAAELGGVDLIVANLGGTVGRGLFESTPEDWQRTFDLNLFHAVRAIRAAVPHMRATGRGGSAVSIASISGWKPGPNAQYGAAKAGEIFLAGALAWERGPQRIRVNTVSPGSILFPGGGWARIERERASPSLSGASFRGAWARPRKWRTSWRRAVERASWINGARSMSTAQGRPSAF
jgi:3-oxoacyl-[acyl-carrier protein] reductase